MRAMLNLARLQTSLQTALESYLVDLQTLVNIDSGTFDKSGVDAVGSFLRDRYIALGAGIETHPDATYGDTFTATWTGAGEGTVLLVGHTDTVFGAGTAISRPFRVDDGRAYGPGVADMKAGDLAILYALTPLQEQGFNDYARIVVLHNSDEEIGSPSSRELIRSEAESAGAVLVLEPGRENGDVVSARKGIADFRLHVHGRPAHAGVNHDRGRSAILELAHLVQRLESLNGRVDGATLNIGQIKTGERINVVPDYAFAHFEVRAPNLSAMDDMKRLVEEAVAQRTVPDTRAEVVSTVEHTPMHKSEGTERLVRRAQTLAMSLGFTIRDVATGGASDGNTAAAAGRPVLDGLGPVGGATHSPEEYIDVASIVPRTALLAGLVAAIGSGDW